MNPLQLSARPGLRSRGFTLIELMVAVAIVAILAIVAYESYQNSLYKSRRSDAKTALLDLASREERFFSVNNTYASTPSQLGLPGTAFPISVQSSNAVYYQMNVTLPTTTTWTATATPQGNQINDTCGTYTLTNLGVQTNSTTATGCW